MHANVFNMQTSLQWCALKQFKMTCVGMGHLGNLYLYHLLERSCCLIQLEFLQRPLRVWKNILIAGLYMCFIWIRILKSFGSIHLIRSLRQRYVTKFFCYNLWNRGSADWGLVLIHAKMLLWSWSKGLSTSLPRSLSCFARVQRDSKQRFLYIFLIWLVLNIVHSI